MPDEAVTDLDGDSMEEQLKAIQISSFEEDEEEDQDEEVEEDADSNSDDVDDDDTEAEPVTLGFVEKPKNGWSLLRHMFPCKAGGVPVCFQSLRLSVNLSFFMIYSFLGFLNYSMESSVRRHGWIPLICHQENLPFATSVKRPYNFCFRYRGSGLFSSNFC